MADYIDREKAYDAVDERINELKGDKEFNIVKEICISGVKKHILSIPTADVIPIPEGATNGDVIKAMFPDIEIVEIVHTREISFVKVRFNGMPDTKIFDLDWWNAPYRLEGRK